MQISGAIIRTLPHTKYLGLDATVSVRILRLLATNSACSCFNFARLALLFLFFVSLRPFRAFFSLLLRLISRLG